MQYRLFFPTLALGLLVQLAASAEVSTKLNSRGYPEGMNEEQGKAYLQNALKVKFATLREARKRAEKERYKRAKTFDLRFTQLKKNAEEVDEFNSGENGYLLYSPEHAGFSTQVEALYSAAYVADLTHRTLVVPHNVWYPKPQKGDEKMPEPVFADMNTFLTLENFATLQKYMTIEQFKKEVGSKIDLMFCTKMSENVGEDDDGDGCHTRYLKGLGFEVDSYKDLSSPWWVVQKDVIAAFEDAPQVVALSSPLSLVLPRHTLQANLDSGTHGKMIQKVWQMNLPIFLASKYLQIRYRIRLRPRITAKYVKGVQDKYGEFIVVQLRSMDSYVDPKNFCQKLLLAPLPWQMQQCQQSFDDVLPVVAKVVKESGIKTVIVVGDVNRDIRGQKDYASGIICPEDPSSVNLVYTSRPLETGPPQSKMVLDMVIGASAKYYIGNRFSAFSKFVAEERLLYGKSVDTMIVFGPSDYQDMDTRASNESTPEANTESQ